LKQQLFKQYFDIVRRWFWLILLMTLVAGATTYWMEQQQPPVYEARVQLIIGPGVESPNPDLNGLRASGQLLQTYAALVTVRPILQTIISNLELDITPSKLEDNIQVKPNQETQILTIYVQAGSEAQAAAIANAIADILVQLSPSGAENTQAQLKDQMRNQAGKVEDLITVAEDMITQLEATLQITNNAEQQRQLMSQISEERNHLSESHRTLAMLYELIQEASINQIRIIEPATGAKVVDTQFQLKMLISVIAGLVLGLVIALGFEYLDTTIKTSEELALLNPTIFSETIAKHKTLKGIGQKRLVVEALPNSDAAENYRILGVKLLSKYKVNPLKENAGPEDEVDPNLTAAPAKPLRSILISSMQVNDDTSEVAANLAVVLAQTGQRVILVDAYLQRPTVGQIFGIVERGGLTTALTTESVFTQLAPIEWMPGLSILPAGPVPSNPFELLASSRMSKLIEQLQNQADIVIITASSLSSSANSLTLTSIVDGVMIVARQGRTDEATVKRAMTSLEMLKANTVGIILDSNESSCRTRSFWRTRGSTSKVGPVSESKPVSLASS
jgi:capsular exopolysaccharide synthesis family protein